MSDVPWWRTVLPGRSAHVIERLRWGTPAANEQRRPAALGEVAGLLLGLWLFARLHASVGKDIATATANARNVQSVERGLHVAIERTANHWLTEHPVLIEAAVYCYRLYYVVLVGVLLWIFVRHADVYVKVRRTFVAMTALVLPVFWVLPVSPPRFALPGIVDIVAEHDIIGAHAAREIGSGHNNYSAMPSLHVGWSIWCAYAAWSALRGSHPRFALLAWIFPLVMAADVLGTGNHYVLDIAGSALLLVVSIAAASAWGHLARLGREARSRPTGRARGR